VEPDKRSHFRPKTDQGWLIGGILFTVQRGLVPSLSYNGQIITESAIVSQFLADAHPSHLLPPSNSVDGALQRARVAFFVDTFFSKALQHFWTGVRAADAAEKDAAAEELVKTIEKELEPLFPENANGPFFGGSERLTLAEVGCTFRPDSDGDGDGSVCGPSLTGDCAQVLTGSFLLRLNSFSKPEYSLLSTKLPTLLEKVPKFKRWVEAVVNENSVNFIWNEKEVSEKTKAKIQQLAAAAK
jgi:glutathione S-transferase